MKESHSNQLLVLIGIIFFLIVAIAIPLVVSQLRKKKNGAPTVSGLPTETRPEPILVETVTAKTETLEVAEPEARVDQALAKTQNQFWGRIRDVLSNSSAKRDEVLENLEEILYTSDLGPQMVESLLNDMRDQLSGRDLTDLKKMQEFLRSKMSELLMPLHEGQLQLQEVRQIVKRGVNTPTVIMIVGVNGAGKTTSIGKIAAQLASQGEKVLVAAGDTFRAAAGGQLKAWTDRAAHAGAQTSNQGQVEIFWPANVTDPAAVAFDCVEKARAHGFSFVLLDTAGRLHSQSHLMEELKKVKRVMGKVLPEAPHETWVVLDGNAGQNAVLQAKEFHQSIGITGIVLTKLDGTAKGGAALSVVQQLQQPIRLIGIGEKVSDLRVFNWKDYVNAILGQPV